MKTETRFVKCGGVGYTIVCNPDDSVAILDSEGRVIEASGSGKQITAADARTMSDRELCEVLSALSRSGP